MKPLVNLASRPYRNRRLFWISILAAFVIFSALGVKTLHDLSSLDDQIAELTPRDNALEVQLRDSQKAKENTAVLSADQNRALQAATDLINRKAFSWSELLNAIERNIPPTVRVTKVTVNKVQPRSRDNVAPSSTNANDGKTVSILLEVVGKSVGDVTSMMNSLERTGHFITMPVKQAPIEGTEDVQFLLNVDYFPQVSTVSAATTTEVAHEVARAK
jgi:Tfp pilus assembly protein PilN